MIYILSSIFAGEGAAISFIFTAVLRAIGSIQDMLHGLQFQDMPSANMYSVNVGINEIWVFLINPRPNKKVSGFCSMVNPVNQ